MRLPPTKEESCRAARLHRSGPPGFQDAIAMGSHTFPSYGHSLGKTARSVGGWST